MLVYPCSSWRQEEQKVNVSLPICQFESEASLSYLRLYLKTQTLRYTHALSEPLWNPGIGVLGVGQVLLLVRGV